MKINLYLKTSLLFFILLIVIAGISQLYYNVSTKYYQALDEIQHSSEIIYRSQVVLSMIQDVETGQRGYLLTSEESFLEPYENAIKNANLEFQNLSIAIEKHSTAKSYFVKLIPLIRKRIDVSRTAIELNKEQRPEEAVAFIKKGKGRQTMDSIRVEIKNIQDIERSNIVLLDKELLSTGKKMGSIEVGALALLLLFIVSMFFSVLRGISKKDKLEKDLQEKNISLAKANDEINIILEEYRAANEELNTTMEKLNSSYSIIQDLNTKLQERVEEKTTDLFAANQNLNEKNQQIIETDERLKATNENLYKTVTELNHRNFELDQFIYKVSHDIRAPLASILGLVGISKLDNAMPTQNVLDLIENRASKLDHYIRSILDYSKNTRSDVVPQLINFEHIIHGTLEEMRYMKNFENLKIYKNIQKDVEFYSDLLRMGIIFNSLISNALKFQDLSKPECFLKIDIYSRADKVKVVLEDNGIGIKEEYQNRIFDMFFRASDLSDGSGLGLYILKQAVHYLNGTVSIESKTGIGTKINFSLPNLILNR